MLLSHASFLVTGATRGIGRALADLLAREGARIAVSGRRPSAVEETVRALRARGAQAVGVAGDVSRDEDARAMADAAFAAFDTLDVLVNNAAVLSPRARVADTPPGVWQEVLSVNVVGTANLIRRVLPRMEARGRGIIVNLSSAWGRCAEGMVAPYCASKFAVEALTQSVADESSKGVIVFALNPGVIRTDMLATAFDGDVAAYPPPETLDDAWRRLFAAVEPSWHGTSRDL